MSWFKKQRSTFSAKNIRPAGNPRNRVRLGLESLEDRVTPSTNNLLGLGTMPLAPTAGAATAMTATLAATTGTTATAATAANPATPTLLGPTGNITTPAPTFTWSASSGATSYQLWVQVTGQTTPLINVGNLTATSYTPTQALAPGSYTMFVRAFSSTGQASAWSASKTFSVAPAAPTLLSPIGNITAQVPTFTWSASSGATSYQLWVQVTGQTTPLINVSNLTATSYTPTQTLAPGSYTMFVRAFSSTGQASAWSASKTFSVAPAAPTLLSPIGNITTPVPTFTWSASAGATSYQLWVQVTGQTTPLINVSNLTAASFTPTQALAPGSYTMWVRAFSSTGQASAWSAPKTFSVAPAAPTLLSPVGNITAQAPTFTWSASAGATSYQLWVQVTGQTTPLINVSNLTATSFTATQALAPGAYTMWVRAFSSTGQASAWSASMTFTVAAPVPVPVPVPVVNLGSQVVAFALSKLNTQVGGGECTDLVSAALQAAGAKTTNDFGVTGLDADYVWGNLVATYQAGDPVSLLANIQPGDIIQYRNVNITSGFTTSSTPHHSAIVQANLGGGKFTVLEQNVNNERWVHSDSLDLSGMTTGTVWIYRPVAK